MRHGTSTANEAGIIVSDTQRGVSGYGLSEKGELEVKASANKARLEKVFNSDTIIISSDFTRARETAEILADVFGIDMITTSPKLRERFFGTLDGKGHSGYEEVWRDDAKDSTHTNKEVESVEHVLDRSTLLIKELGLRYNDKTIVLISHGDTLQILQTAFEDISPSEHRNLTPLKTAEVRALNLQ